MGFSISDNILKEFNSFFILIPLLLCFTTQVRAQPDIVDCNDPNVAAGYCSGVCGTNAQAQCAAPPDVVCLCAPNCHTGATPIAPDPLNAGMCPDPDPAIDATLQAVCNGVCVTTCLNPGGTGQFCAHPAGPAGEVISICTCGCFSDACPATTTTTDIGPLLAWGAGVTAIKKTLKGFLGLVKAVYVTLFFLGKIFIAQLVGAGVLFLIASGVLTGDDTT